MTKAKPTGEPHWKNMIELYFKFCEKNFGTQPSFDGSAAMALKHLLKEFKKRSEQNNLEWSLQCAEHTFNIFLEVAISDPWIANNFFLRTLNSQKDKIFFKIASNGKFNTTKQSTGSTVNTSSAFSKIDQLFSSHAK